MDVGVAERARFSGSDALGDARSVRRPPVKGDASEAGAGGLHHEDGTIDVVPSGVQTEGASTR